MKSLGALAISPITPLMAAASKAPLPTTLAVNANYTPFMQANALAILRNHGSLSMTDFVQMTGLNSAQSQAMLARFAKNGLIEGQTLGSGVINAVKPEWMKDFAANAAKNSEKISQFKRSKDSLKTPRAKTLNEPPKFDAIECDCEANDYAPSAPLEMASDDQEIKE